MTGRRRYLDSLHTSDDEVSLETAEPMGTASRVYEPQHFEEMVRIYDAADGRPKSAPASTRRRRAAPAAPAAVGAAGARSRQLSKPAGAGKQPPPPPRLERRLRY